MVEFLSSVDGRGLNRAKEKLGHARLLDIDEMRLEHALGCFEPFRADLDDPSVRKLLLGKKNTILGAYGRKQSQHSTPAVRYNQAIKMSYNEKRFSTDRVVLNQNSGVLRESLVLLQVVTDHRGRIYRTF